MRAASPLPWWAWLAVPLTAVHLYAVLLSSFGVIHLGLLLADTRTKDIMTNRTSCRACCTCSHRRGALLWAWRRQWCGPVLRKSARVPRAARRPRAVPQPLLDGASCTDGAERRQPSAEGPAASCSGGSSGHSASALRSGGGSDIGELSEGNRVCGHAETSPEDARPVNAAFRAAAGKTPGG